MNPLAKKKFDSIKNVFSLDLRSLALFRICLSITILADLLLRSRDLLAHYTDYGVMPRQSLGLETSPWLLSIHNLSGEVYFQAILFLLATSLAVCLLIGLKTQYMVFLNWLMLISLQNRNPLVLSGADVGLDLMMFWALFLPLGARFSIDSLIGKHNHRSNSVFTAATIALISQVFIVYFFSFLAKNSPEWRIEGSAIHYALNSLNYSTELGKFLLGFPSVNKFLSYSTLLIESLLPLLLLFPIKNSVFRLIFVTTMAVMHISFGITLSIGIFTLVFITLLTPLLPSIFWDYLYLRFKSIETKQENNSFTLSPLISIVVFAALSYVIIWNISNFKNFRFLMPGELKHPGFILHLNQNWTFFAPPSHYYTWFIVSGEDYLGKSTNLLQPDKPYTIEKPDLGEPYFQNHRWAMYYLQLLNNYSDRKAEDLLEFYCRSHQSGLRHVRTELILRQELIALDNYEKKTSGNKKLFSKKCI